MKTVKLLSRIDASRCKGDAKCAGVCPTDAIRMVEKKATVDAASCVACFKCWDICQHDAVTKVHRSEPMLLAVPLERLDQAKVDELCRQARVAPDRVICGCATTTAKEAAAAILAGARSLKDLTLMTGAGSGCGGYCIPARLRLLKAGGVKDFALPKGLGLYDLSVDLWSIPEDVARKYGEFYVVEDRDEISKLA